MDTKPRAQLGLRGNHSAGKVESIGGAEDRRGQQPVFALAIALKRRLMHPAWMTLFSRAVVDHYQRLFASDSARAWSRVQSPFEASRDVIQDSSRDGGLESEVAMGFGAAGHRTRTRTSLRWYPLLPRRKLQRVTERRHKFPIFHALGVEMSRASALMLHADDFRTYARRKLLMSLSLPDGSQWLLRWNGSGKSTLLSRSYRVAHASRSRPGQGPEWPNWES